MRPTSASAPASNLSTRAWIAAFLTFALYATTELRGIEPPLLRLAVTAVVLALVAWPCLRWWRTSAGVGVVVSWAVLSVANLWSPLMTVRSAVDLTTTVLAVVLVVQVAQVVDADRLRNLVTAYAAGVLGLALLARAAQAAASGGFALDALRVDTTAAGLWKGVVILSPCPVRWLPARLLFYAFKLALLFLMLSVDRPKIGVLLSASVALAVGAVLVLLHRAAARRNVLMACLVMLPIVIVPALMVGNWLVGQYGRRTDFSGRTVLWRAAIDEATQAGSILGVGFRNSLTSVEAVTAMSERFGGNFSDELGGNAVHNVYLQVVVEFGLVGIAAIALVLAVALGGLVRLRSVRSQATLAVDLLFVLGLCLSEPVLEPNTTIFALACLTVVRIRAHLRRERPGSGVVASQGPSEDVDLARARRVGQEVGALRPSCS